MDSFVTLQDVANIVTFIAPGYFAVRIYSLIYTKKEQDFSRLVIESVVYSVPLVTCTNILWEKLWGAPVHSVLHTRYALLLLLVALCSGVLAAVLRKRWPVAMVASWCGLGAPNDDFVKDQLLRVRVRDSHNSPVTVTLQNGDIFSGTVDQMSRYSPDGPNYFYFTNLAWFVPDTGEWDEREGGLLVDRSEVVYLETPRLRPQPTASSVRQER